MKHDVFCAVCCQIVLKYEDGSKEVVKVTAADGAVVKMVARGWLMSSPLAVSVRYCRVDENGRCLGIGGEYVR